jgi:nitroreductase
MDLFEAMRCAPTTRRFKTDPVPREALLRALEAARFAPSGGNRQGWRVVVVEDAERRAALRELYLPPWRAYMEQTGAARMLAEPESFEAARVRTARLADEYATGLDRVPVHLVVGVRLGDLAVTDAALPRRSPTRRCRARASWAGRRCTPSYRTCCWACAPRVWAPP